MTLGRCRECAKEVSSDAPSCPHCGARKPLVAEPAKYPKIPMWRVVGDAYANTLEDLGRIYLLAWKPFLVTLVLTGIIGFFDGFFRTGMVASSTLGMLITFLMNALFALSVHRLRLFGWNDYTRTFHFAFKKPERLFLAFGFGAYVTLGFLPYVAAKAANGTLLITVGVLIFCLIPLMVVIGLCLPAAAAGEDEPILFGWRLGVGSWWRLLGVMLLCAIPIEILVQLSRAFLPQYPVTGPIVVSILNYPVSAVAIGGICGAYKERTKQGSLQPTSGEIVAA